MRFLLLVVLAMLIPGIVAAFLGSCELLVGSGTVAIAVLGGVILGAVLDRLVIRRIPYLDVLEHEATHAFAALLFLRRVTRFVVHRDSGYMCHTSGFGGSFGDHFIGLAPYFLPVTTFILVLLRPVVAGAWFPWYDVAVGASLGHHTVNAFRDVKRNWSGGYAYWGSGDSGTDITKRGRVFAAVFIVAIGVTITGVLVEVLCRGYSGVVSWARSFVAAELAAVTWAVAGAARILGR